MSELNFVNTDTDEIYKTIIGELENGVAEALYPGDERRIFGEALVSIISAVYSNVNDACRQKLLRYARGDVLDALGENKGVERIPEQNAKTILRFSISSPLEKDVIIPKGVMATSDFERYFVTDEEAVIPSEETFVDVPATAENGGVNYNQIPVGHINIIRDLISYVDTVENLTITAGGSDKETDDSLRERIRAASNKTTTAGPAASYRYWAMQADASIADAIVTSPEACKVVITPILYGGEIPSAEILGKVLAACNADDVRVLTDTVEVQAPTTVSFDINIKCYAAAEDMAECRQTVDEAVEKYIEWQSSALNRDINPDYLRKLILAPGDGKVGASRIDIISPAFTVVPANKVAKFSGNKTINFTEWED